jgi:IclR family pca regulon transcriptional regulator
LNRLAVQSAHSFSAVVLDDEEVVIVARSDVARVMANGLHLGARLPAHATSTGRVLLAAKAKSDLNLWLKGRTLSRLTGHTVTDVKALRARIAQTQTDDFAISCEEHELGVSAMSVPLRNAQGKTVAALNVVLSSAEMNAANIQQLFLPLLQGAAQELRALL